jgi:hypothetical protein
MLSDEDVVGLNNTDEELSTDDDLVAGPSARKVSSNVP